MYMFQTEIVRDNTGKPIKKFNHRLHQNEKYSGENVHCGEYGYFLTDSMLVRARNIFRFCIQFGATTQWKR